MNSLSGRWEVQQKHAHTWLEAYVDRRWETLDPTPAVPREESVSQSGALDWWTDLKVVFSDNWFDIIHKMSLQRQEEFIRPWLTSLKGGMETIRQQGLWAALKIFVEEVVLQPKKWFSWQTGVVTFLVLLFLSLSARQRPDRWLLLRIKKLAGWIRPAERRHLTVVRFYENFCAQCARHGLRFPKHQTAQENAAMAEAYFEGRLNNVDDRALPRRIAGAFNNVRFGDALLSADAIEQVRDDVTRFTQVLNTRERQLIMDR